MEVGGYRIFVENSHWVHEDILYSETYERPILDKVLRLLENPDYPAFAMVDEFHKLKAFRFDHVRVFVRVYEAARVVGILAAIAAGDVKRDERSGTMTKQFMGHLRRFIHDTIPASLIPWPEEVVAAEAPALEPEVAPDWGVRILATAIDESRAMELLDISRPTKGRGCRIMFGDFAERAMDSVGRAQPGDRVLLPLPESRQPYEKEKLVAMSQQLRRALKFFGKRYSVRFDDPSQKFILVPPDKLSVYCSVASGRRMAANSCGLGG